MILQTFVDSNMRFIDGFAGFAGFVHDARVFGRSKHAELVNAGQRLNGPMKQVYGVQLILIEYGFVFQGTNLACMVRKRHLN